MSVTSTTASETDFGKCAHRGSDMVLTAGVIGAERVLQGRGQDDAFGTEKSHSIGNS